MMLPKHPAKYTDTMIPVFAKLLKGRKAVLDPMAGTGKLSLIRKYGFAGKVFCNDIENDWIDPKYGVAMWTTCDAAALPYPDKHFDAICTSPTYGNRFADKYSPDATWTHMGYSHSLKRSLHPANTGQMQWGDDYRSKHEQIYRECVRVLRSGGLFIVNISNHIRGGKEIFAVEWHCETLISLGLTFLLDRTISTPRMCRGKNREARVIHEHILVLEKP